MFSAVKSRQRFDLLLLEEGEYYFEDFSGYHYPPSDDNDPNPHQKRFIKNPGRIRLCSRSIIFEPEDTRLPVVKLPFKNTRDTPSQWKVPLISSFKSDVQYFVVDCKQMVEMRVQNEDQPYHFRKSVGDHKFSLDYVKLAEVLPKVQRLFSVSKLGYGEREDLLKEMIRERESAFKFDTTWLHDLTERTQLEIRCSRIQPLIATPGILLVTNTRVYFQSFNNLSQNPVEKWRLGDINRLCTRRYVLRHTGLEFIMNDGQSFFLAFSDTASRDRVRTTIFSQPGMLSLQSNDSHNMTLKWQNGVVSNYEYLMYLNHLADRTFNDITQYPVFPWVLKDYESATLNLDDPSVYRDLSKPIGALNPKRLDMLQQRMKDMPEPKFLYGTHYSTPGYVLFFLVRQCPELMLRLQNGKFDAPDRLFSDIAETWKGVYTNPTDLKELIPEFYRTDSEFLQNERQLDLGVRQNGHKVGDVVLPPWAKDARDFHQKLADALEGDYVSDHLHEWIDLIFGYKQVGEEAITNNNLFFHLTYEGAVDIEAESDPVKRNALEAQIREFGQTPKQLFTTPHPHRLPRQDRDTSVGDTLAVQLAGLARDGGDAGGNTGGSRSLSAGWGDISELGDSQSFRLHRDAITAICLSEDAKIVYSTSQDTTMKIYNIGEKRQIRSVSLGGLALSSCLLTPDGKNVIVGSWDNNIYTYSIDYGRVTDTLTSHDDAVSCLGYRNGTLLSASWDSTILAWKVTDNKVGQTPTRELLEHEAEVKCLDIDAGAHRAVSGGSDGVVVLWDLSGAMAMRTIEAHDDEVTAVKFTPDARRIVSASKDGYLKVFEVEGSEVWHVDTGEPLSCIDTDGVLVVAGGGSGKVRIWELTEGTEKTPLKQYGGAQSAITCLTVANDGSTLVAGAADYSINVWSRS